MHVDVELVIPKLAAALHVQALSSDNVGLMQHYQFNIQLLSDTEIDLLGALGLIAQLKLSADKKTSHYTGLIGELQFMQQTKEGFHYQLQFISPLELLAINSHNRVFVEKTVKQRLTTLLAMDHFYPQVDWQLKQNYLNEALRIQYHETDLVFFERQLSYWGIYYNFIWREGQPVLLITDHLNAIPSGSVSSLSFAALSGMPANDFCVTQITQETKVLPAAVVCHDYNPDVPTIDLTVRSSNKTAIAGNGELHRYQDQFSDVTSGQRLVDLRGEALDCQRQVFYAQSNCPLITAGQWLEITGHRYAGKYRVINIEHQWHNEQSQPYQQDIDAPAQGYQNKLMLIDASLAYRPDVQHYPKPLHSTFTATVEGPSDDVFLDQQGRYQVRFMFDTENPRAQASCPVRMVQPHVGTDHGMHMPLKPGSEVLLLCQNGDIDRPVILGALPNVDNPSTVTENNPTQHIIKSHTNHQLIMDDQKHYPRVQLATDKAQEALILHAKKNVHLVSLLSNAGDLDVLAGKNHHDSSQDDFVQDVGADHIIRTQQDYTVTTDQGDIQHHAEKNIDMSADNSVKLTSQSDTLSQTAGSNLLLSTENNAQLLSTLDLQLTTDQGDITLQAAKSINFTAGQKIILQQGQGRITLDDDGISIEAPEVNLIGDMVSFKAPKIKVGGNGQGTNTAAQQTAGDVHASALDWHEESSQTGQAFINSNYTIGNDGGAAQSVSNAAIRAAQQKKSVRYDYYVVTYDGIKMKIADSIEDDIVDFIADFQLGDYFEKARWEEETSTTSVNKEVEGEMRESVVKRTGVAVGISLLNTTIQLAYRKTLIRDLNNLQSNLKKEMPSSGGVLVQINCEVAPTEENESIRIKNAFILGKGTDYKPLIKKAMTGTAVIARPPEGYHWEYLFVWVTSHQD